MNSKLRKEIAEFGRDRGTNVVVYFFPDGTTKLIDNCDVPILYRCLNGLGPGRKIDLFLQTDGGSISGARRLALMLREFSNEVSVFVLHRARSSGTLIALSAKRIIMSALSELGPVDPNLVGNGGIQGAMPGKIASEEVRTFTDMMANWFGLTKAQQRAEAFEMLAQKIFPTTLTALFRAERYVKDVTLEILEYHLPTRPKSVHRKLAQRLVAGYWDHGHGITRGEGAAMGLNILAASSHEEQVMERVRIGLTEYCNETRGAEVAACNAVLFSGEYSARFVQRWAAKQDEGEVTRAGKTDRGLWEEL